MKELSLAMLRAGIFGFGGGPSVMPLFRHEAVKKYHWMDDDEFSEILAIANALPGPIATKMAGYLGYRLHGALGAIWGVICHILPSSILMIALLSIVGWLSSSKIVIGMIAAVMPVVVIMLLDMALQFSQKSLKGLGIVMSIVFFAIAILLLEVLHIHSGVAVILFLIYGAAHFKLVERVKRWRKGGDAS